MPRFSTEHVLPDARDGDDLGACEALMRGGSKSFHAASRLLPRRVRGPAIALYAFCRLADDVTDLHGHEPGAVDDLSRRLEAIYRGAPDAVPADRALAAVVRRFRIPFEVPAALLEGFRWDLEGRRYETLSDLLGYCARVAGTVGVMMSLVMDTRSPRAIARACELGAAMQLTNIARDVGEDASLGRVYLPLSWLREAGIDPDAWLHDPAFGPGIAAVVARLLQAADALYRRSEHGIAALPRDCRPAIRAARLVYSEIGREVERHGHDSVTRRAVVARRRKAALMARALSSSVFAPAFGAGPSEPMHEFTSLVQAVQNLDAGQPARAKARLPHRSFDEKMAWMAGLFERLAENDRAARRGTGYGSASFD